MSRINSARASPLAIVRGTEIVIVSPSLDDAKGVDCSSPKAVLASFANNDVLASLTNFCTRLSNSGDTSGDSEYIGVIALPFACSFAGSLPLLGGEDVDF